MILAELADIVPAFVPVDANTAGATGDWVSLKHYQRVSVCLIKSGSSEPLTIKIQQATAVAGTGAKVLNFTRIDSKVASDLTTVGTYTKTTQSSSDSHVVNSAAAPDRQALVQIDFAAEDLDVEGGFDCIRATVNDPGTTSQLVAMFYLLRGGRYLPPLSAIVD